MKKLLFCFVSLLVLSSCTALNKSIGSSRLSSNETITFMGIPIDGTKRAFIQELKRKGFRYDSTGKLLVGQFDGRTVNLVVSTNKNKVDRVYVMFPHNTSREIKNEYNILLEKFKRNDKYMSMLLNEAIPDDEDIAYEISSKGKRYDAAFYAKPSNYEELKDEILRTFFGLEGSAEDSKLTTNERLTKLYSEKMLGTVWFTIFQDTFHLGQFYIGLYYDNEKNRPHGEDL